MASAIQSRTRLQIRHSIGRNSGLVTIGTAKSTVDTSSLIDTVGLAQFSGDDEINGRQVMIHTPVGSIVAGEKSIISDFAASTSDATVAPVFSAAITNGDGYEIWKTPWMIEDINDIIDQVIADITGQALQVKQSQDTFTTTNQYEYNCLSGFVGLNKVEYQSTIGTEIEIDDCDTAMTAGANVTATADSAFKKEGTASAKLVVAAGAGVQLLAYGTISSIDISQCNQVEMWFYSSVTLTAGQLKLYLDDTAACVSALETINIPATTAATWTRHVLTLANPHLDTAIISWGIYQTSDVGACTLYVDFVNAVDSLSRAWTPLNPQQWAITKGTTPYLRLTSSGLSVVGTDRLLMLTGCKIASLMSADTSTCEIDPSYVIAAATWFAMIGHAKSPSIDLNNRQALSDRWKVEMERKKPSVTFDLPSDMRWV
ncbi:MAG: hypothetical protein WC560_10705 [Syntrophales bacterium]